MLINLIVYIIKDEMYYINENNMLIMIIRIGLLYYLLLLLTIYLLRILNNVYIYI